MYRNEGVPVVNLLLSDLMVFLGLNNTFKKIFFLLFLTVLNSSCQSQEKIGPYFFCKSNMSSPYGICTHVNRKGPRFEFETREQDLMLISSIGASWIRTDFDWGSMVTPKDGMYSFSHFDRMMKSVDSLRLKTLAIVTLSPNYKKSGRKEWIKIIKMQVEHFKQIKCWELINEVDIIKTNNNNIYASDYIKLLKEAYPAIKRTHPKTTVLFSGLAFSDSQFLDSILSEKVGNYFDVMNVHRYNHKKSVPEDLITYYQGLRDKLGKYRLNKPIWLTECGCSTATGWNTESDQANRLPRIFIISFACGIDKVFWYKSRSSELETNNFECFFGLWHKDYAPKPAYYAYKALTKMCPDRSTRPKLERNNNVYMSNWKRPDGKNVWALWTSKSEEKVKLNIKGKHNIYNLNGNKLSRDNNNEYKITPSIIYIVGATYVNIAN